MCPIEKVTEIGYVKVIKRQPIGCHLSVSMNLWQIYLIIYIGPLESLEASQEQVHHLSCVLSPIHLKKIIYVGVACSTLDLQWDIEQQCRRNGRQVGNKLEITQLVHSKYFYKRLLSKQS